MKSLKDALITIRRSPYQSMLAIIMASITFFVAYTASMAVAGAELTLKFFETRPQVVAFFEIEASEDEIQQANDEMKNKPYVTDVKLITKDEALAIYKDENKENPLVLELVTADILPASIEVSSSEVEYLDVIQENLEQIPAIEDVVYQQDIVESLTQWTNTVRTVGMISVGILALVAFLTMLVTISVKVTSKRNSIHIMKIIGANDWYVASPFVLEGALYGFLGSIIGWVGMYALLLYLTPWIKDFLGPIVPLPVPWEVFAWQFLVGTAFGVLLGSFASILAAKRMLKK